MGCDIHAYVEIQDQSTGEWKYVNHELPRNRDYWAFHFLAGVRDPGPFGKGRDDRGIPNDISPEVLLLNSKIGNDGHSHSFFTLQELVSLINSHNKIAVLLIPLETYMKKKEYTIEEIENLDEKRYKTNNIQMILSENQADQLILDNKVKENKKKYVNQFLNFKITRDSSLISNLVSHLTMIAKSYNLTTKQVRVVFWFDN